MTVDHFYKVTAPLLKTFINVRITEDLSTLKETDAHKKKGKTCDIGTTDEPWLLEMAHKCRSKEVIAKNENHRFFQVIILCL